MDVGDIAPQHPVRGGLQVVLARDGPLARLQYPDRTRSGRRWADRTDHADTASQRRNRLVEIGPADPFDDGVMRALGETLVH